MKPISQRQQRTLARTAEVQGIGYITGKSVQVRFRPAPPHTGVVFVRVDLGPQACIPAHIDYVTGTHRRTTLGEGPLQVGLVEHVLAALHGLAIDNCYVELNAPEPPGLDGSAQAFVKALCGADILCQKETKTIWGVDKAVQVRHQQATLTLHPAEAPCLRASYFLDYGTFSPIHPQVFTADISPESFLNDISLCRTFLLEEEADEFRKQGLGSRTTLSDLLVFGPHGPISNKLRFANEPARHKVLDIIGDLALLGQGIAGHVVGNHTGHTHNVELVKLLHKQLAGQQPCQRQRVAA